MRRTYGRRMAAAHKGFTLIEVLVSLLVFSFGILALVGLQATAVRLSTDARDRASATFLADQLLARMLVADPADKANFAHKASGSACAPTGSASTHAVVTGWLSEVGKVLPNAASDDQQVVVTSTGTGANEVTDVTVRLCWQRGNDTPHTLVVTNRVQWQ